MHSVTQFHDGARAALFQKSLNPFYLFATHHRPFDFVLGIGYYLYSNMQANLARQNVSTGFDYLRRESGFGIGESWIQYSPAGTSARLRRKSSGCRDHPDDAADRGDPPANGEYRGHFAEFSSTRNFFLADHLFLHGCGRCVNDRKMKQQPLSWQAEMSACRGPGRFRVSQKVRLLKR